MKTLFLLIAGLLVFSPLQSAVGQLPAPESGPFYRYLILIDSSAPMKRRREATAKSVADLIHSGFGGQIERGDAIGIWTFGKTVNPAVFPVFKWNESMKPGLTAQALKLIVEQDYAGSSNLDQAVEAVLMATRTSKELTVFIFSDGSEVIYGTPFDLKISTVYILHRDRLKASKSPFITSLAARNGRVQAWAVDSGGGAVTIPQIDEPKAPQSARKSGMPADRKKPKSESEAPPAKQPTPQRKPRPKPRVVQSIEMPRETARQAAPPPGLARETTTAPAHRTDAGNSGSQAQSEAGKPAATASKDPGETVSTTAASKPIWPPKTVTPRPNANKSRNTVSTTPAATTPAATTPAATPPAATPPAATTPIATTPIATTPIATTPIATTPVATPTVATPPTAAVPSSLAQGPTAATDSSSTSNTPTNGPSAPGSAQTAIATPLEDPGSSSRLMFMAIALVLASIVIAFLALRRPRASAHASIISQSLDRERE